MLFQPETERVVVGQEKKADGSIKQKYVIAKTLVKDVVFEETHDNSMNVEDEEGEETTAPSGGSSTGTGTDSGSGSSTGTDTGGGDNNGNGGGGDNGGGFDTGS